MCLSLCVFFHPSVLLYDHHIPPALSRTLIATPPADLRAVAVRSALEAYASTTHSLSPGRPFEENPPAAQERDRRCQRSWIQTHSTLSPWAHDSTPVCSRWRNQAKEPHFYVAFFANQVGVTHGHAQRKGERCRLQTAADRDTDEVRFTRIQTHAHTRVLFDFRSNPSQFLLYFPSPFRSFWRFFFVSIFWVV